MTATDTSTETEAKGAQNAREVRKRQKATSKKAQERKSSSKAKSAQRKPKTGKRKSTLEMDPIALILERGLKDKDGNAVTEAGPTANLAKPKGLVLTGGQVRLVAFVIQRLRATINMLNGIIDEQNKMMAEMEEHLPEGWDEEDEAEEVPEQGEEE